MGKNYFRNIILLIYFFLFSQVVKAQQVQPVQADRPDQTETPFTVQKAHFQIETGLLYEQEDKFNSSVVYPGILLKYGVNNNFELRLITENSGIKTNNITSSGIEPLRIGFKTRLLDEKGIVPATSFLGNVAIPELASPGKQLMYLAPSFRFSMQHTLSRKFSLGYNLGAEWDGFSAEPIFIYTLTTGFSVTEKTGCFAEIYGFASQQKRADHRFDAGITFLLRQNLLLDISGGIGLLPSSPDFFISTGFSFRLKD